MRLRSINNFLGSQQKIFKEKCLKTPKINLRVSRGCAVATVPGENGSLLQTRSRTKFLVMEGFKSEFLRIETAKNCWYYTLIEGGRKHAPSLSHIDSHAQIYFL